jgi:group I intron endonuclease
MKITGIYKIESSKNKRRCYIGSANDIMRRWWTHLSELQKGTHHSLKLQRHYDKYGKSDLQFSILLTCDKELLIQNEQFFLDSYDTYFNNCKIAESQIGLKRSLEARERMRIAKLGKKHSEEHKRKIGLAHLGSKRSEEAKKKMSIKAMGNKNSLGTHRIVSDETRKNMSESHKGKKQSEKTKQKRSLAMMGKNKKKM